MTVSPWRLSLGAVEEDVVDLIAELAFKETGNARFGIELLWRAGKYADAEEAGVVEPECVRMAVSSIVPSMRKSDLAGLSLHEKLFLLAVARSLRKTNKLTLRYLKLKKPMASSAKNSMRSRTVTRKFGITPSFSHPWAF